MPTNMIQKLGSLLNQPGGIPQLTDDKGIEIFAKNANAIILGSSTKEGGNIEVFRNDTGDLQLSVDADAASNGEAVVIFGGVVCQNYLTVGQTTLNSSYNLFVDGPTRFNGNHLQQGWLRSNTGLLSLDDNQATLNHNIDISGSDAIDHSIKLQIDSNDIIVAQATGDGAGGITNPAIGLYPGTTPTTQAVAISDPAESTAGNNAAIDSILAALRAIGLIAT